MNRRTNTEKGKGDGVVQSEVRKKLCVRCGCKDVLVVDEVCFRCFTKERKEKKS